MGEGRPKQLRPKFNITIGAIKDGIARRAADFAASQRSRARQQYRPGWVGVPHPTFGVRQRRRAAERALVKKLPRKEREALSADKIQKKRKRRAARS
jgi:hypothetical protein